MRVRKKTLSAGLVLCAGYFLGMTANTNAQAIFQGIFPAGGSHDAARGGVLHTPDGGSISVGESQSFGAGDYDVYVVKTDRCGSLEWSTTYDFGGNDFGRKIRMTEDGGYVIVGSTENLNSCCSRSDILFFQINSKGGFEWAHTYGGPAGDEGNDVQSYFGKGYVIAGTTSSYGFGKVNGYLLFVDNNGVASWGRSYGGEAVEGFNSCAITASGDILAAGSSMSFTGNQDLFIVRTDIGGSLIWANIYPTKGTDDARCIISFGKDEIMVAGYTTNATSTRDGLLVHLDGNGTLINDRIFAEANLKFDDELAEVHQLPNGNFIVTGYMTEAPGAFGGKDVYLSEVDGSLGIQWYSMHGGPRDDEGFSVAYSTTTRRPFYTVAGVTNSFAKGEDLYLIRSITGGRSGCNDTQGKIEIFKIDLPNKQIDFCVPRAYNDCVTKTPTVYHEKHKVLCTSCRRSLEEAEDPDLGHLDQGISAPGNTEIREANNNPVGSVVTSGQVTSELLAR